MFFKKKPNIILHPFTICKEPSNIYFYGAFQIILSDYFNRTNSPRAVIEELDRCYELYPNICSFNWEVMQDIYYICPILNELIGLYVEQCHVCIKSEANEGNYQWTIYPLPDMDENSIGLRYDSNQEDVKILMKVTKEFFVSKGWNCIRSY